MDMDLIDRGALRKELAYMWYDNMNATAEDVEKRIFDAPTVEAVRHGKWIEPDYVYFGSKRYICDQCKEDEYWIERFHNHKENYCPNCGAKMDGEKK